MFVIAVELIMNGLYYTIWLELRNDILIPIEFLFYELPKCLYIYIFLIRVLVKFL